MYMLYFYHHPFFIQAHESNKDGGINVEKLLEMEKSWDGVSYQAYPKGTPQLSILKITVAPNTSLPWHEHPIPNAAYVLKGALTVEKKRMAKNTRLGLEKWCLRWSTALIAVTPAKKA
ncbi:MAG: hypothetical protein ACMX3H_19680 [Sodalis sp. (in: enterobacteria)]